MNTRALLRSVACTPADFGLFFGPEDEGAAERDSREAQAMAICAGCTAQASCLEWALAHRITHGVWGGTGEQERQRLANPDSLPLCGNNEHVMTPENTYTYPNGVKSCRACRAAGPLRREPRSHDRQQPEEEAA